MVIGLKVKVTLYILERESERYTMGKKRVTKIKCPNGCKEFSLEEQIELGNYDKIGSIKYVYCPCCGEEIIV